MRSTRLIRIFAVAIVVALATPSLAGVSIFNDRIKSGTEIKVLDPDLDPQSTPDLQSLINAIGDAGSGNPYLIKLGPGRYIITANETTSKGLVMKPWVSIMGSRQGVTILAGAIAGSGFDATSAIVAGADNAALTDLSVENAGVGDYAIAIWNANASPRIQNVSAAAPGAAVVNYGVRNDAASPSMINVVAFASGATNVNLAVRIVNSAPTMVNIVTTAVGGVSSRGVYASGGAGTMVNVVAKVSGGDSIE